MAVERDVLGLVVGGRVEEGRGEADGGDLVCGELVAGEEEEEGPEGAAEEDRAAGLRGRGGWCGCGVGGEEGGDLRGGEVGEILEGGGGGGVLRGLLRRLWWDRLEEGGSGCREGAEEGG